MPVDFRTSIDLIHGRKAQLLAQLEEASAPYMEELEFLDLLAGTLGDLHKAGHLTDKRLQHSVKAEQGKKGPKMPVFDGRTQLSDFLRWLLQNRGPHTWIEICRELNASVASGRLTKKHDRGNISYHLSTKDCFTLDGGRGGKWRFVEDDDGTN